MASKPALRGPASRATQLSLNERAVLDCIRRQQSVPRRDIAEIVGLTEATVSRLTHNLEKHGLIHDVETPERSGLRGHPVRPLALNPGGAYAAGIDFYPDCMDVAVLDLNGTMVWKQRNRVSNPSIEKIAALTRRALEKCTAKLGLPPSALCGLGVAVPGYRATRAGSFAIHPDLKALLSVDLQASLAGELQLPVFIERDSVAAALGETLLGNSRDAGSICFLFLARGIGGAVLTGGKAIHGAHGNAGGMGALFPVDRRRPSGNDLLKYLHTAGTPVNSFAELERLDPDSGPLRKWITEAGRALREGVTIASRLFDPHSIIVGGHLPMPITQALVTEIGTLDRPDYYTDDIPYAAVRCSAFGPICSLVGAASLPLLNTYFIGSAHGPSHGDDR